MSSGWFYAAYNLARPEEIERLLDMHGVFKAENIIPFPDLSIKSSSCRE